MEENKIFRFGIDKIKLFNFDLKTDKKWKTQNIENGNAITEQMTIKDELFSIVSNYTITMVGNDYSENTFNHITFNPNKVLSGDNIRNSSTEDLKKVALKLTEILAKKEVYIDLTTAKISEIEFNINMPVNFEEYKKVFQLFIFQFRDSKFVGRFIRKEEEKESRADETYFAKINRTSEFLIYDKAKEAGVDQIVTRMEYRIGADSYRYNANLYGLTNSLEDLYHHPEIPELIFVDRAKRDFLQKSFQFLEANIKPVLEREYLNFKKNNHFARINGRKTRRNVYKHLTAYNIFDYSFLIELVKKHDNKNYKREKERIMRKYAHYNNIDKLNHITNFIFRTFRTKCGSQNETKPAEI